MFITSKLIKRIKQMISTVNKKNVVFGLLIRVLTRVSKLDFAIGN